MSTTDTAHSAPEQSSQPCYPDVIPLIETWLKANAKKIQQFWIGAEWRLWARYDLFVAIENAFEDEYLVTHGNPLWESHNEGEEVDILLEHRNGDMNLAIRLRCERVNENCGSFETFSEDYQKDWNLLKELDPHVDYQYAGNTRVMLLGLSGDPMVVEEDLDPLFGELKPEGFKTGEVYVWYLYDDIKNAEAAGGDTQPGIEKR